MPENRSRPFSSVVARRTWPGGDPGGASRKPMTMLRAGLPFKSALPETAAVAGEVDFNGACANTVAIAKRSIENARGKSFRFDIKTPDSPDFSFIFETHTYVIKACSL